MPTPYNSAVDICNLALTYLGERAIRSIEQPESDPAKMLARVFDSSRQYCLTLAGWTFASKQIAILASSTPPLFGFENAYPLPADYISLISVIGDPTITWGGWLCVYQIQDLRKRSTLQQFVKLGSYRVRV